MVLAAGNIRITPIPSSEGRVLVSFTARDAWTQDTREVLQTGMQVMFDYEVELRRPTPFGLFDPVLARAHVSSLAEFDTLTGDYKVTPDAQRHASCGPSAASSRPTSGSG